MIHLNDFIFKQRKSKNTRSGLTRLKLYKKTCDSCNSDQGYCQRNVTYNCHKCNMQKIAEDRNIRRSLYPKCPKCNGDKYHKSKVCRKCFGRPGSKNPNWKGDESKTKLQKLIRSSTIYKSFIKSVMVRDKYTCQYTGQIGGELEVHHVPELHEIIDLYSSMYDNREMVISKVLEAHKDLDIGITVSKRHHKQVIHKDSYNFKYKERQPKPKQSKEVYAKNIKTGEILFFISFGQAAKYTKTSIGFISNLCNERPSIVRKDWIFSYDVSGFVAVENKYLSIPATKKCSKCKKIKCLTNFNKLRTSKSGVISACKECSASFRRSSYLKNREKYIKRQRDYCIKKKIKSTSISNNSTETLEIV